jgi:urea carboxylase
VDADSSDAMTAPKEDELPPGCSAIVSPVTGSVWQISVSVGEHIAADQELLVVEAMKMEIPLIADEAGEVIEVRVSKGSAVMAGQTLAVIRSKALS